MSATHEVRGVGHLVKRKEDARFLRGRASTSTTSPCRRSHGDPAQSIRPRAPELIDTSAEALPGVVAVVTGS